MDVLNTVDITLKVFGWLLGIILIGLIIFLVVIRLKYNVKFRIRSITKGKNLVFDDRARIVTNKKKIITGWKLLRKKHVIPVPPSEAIDIDNKGHLLVEAFLTPDGEYIYITSNKIIGKNNICSLDPLTSDDKSFYASQYKDSLKYKGVDWSGVIMMATSGVVLVVVLVLALIFVQKLFIPAQQCSSLLVNAIESAKSCGVTFNMTGVHAP